MPFLVKQNCEVSPRSDSNLATVKIQNLQFLQRNVRRAGYNMCLQAIHGFVKIKNLKSKKPIYICHVQRDLSCDCCLCNTLFTFHHKIGAPGGVKEGPQIAKFEDSVIHDVKHHVRHEGRVQ